MVSAPTAVGHSVNYRSVVVIAWVCLLYFLLPEPAKAVARPTEINIPPERYR